MDGKPASQLPPTVTVIEQAEGNDKKSRVTRKYAIIAVTSVVVTALVIVGILVGVKFFLDSTNDIVKKSYRISTQKGVKVDEDVDVSVSGNFVQYHVNDEDTEVWAVDDFNRDLQVMKVRRPGFGTICFVAKLSRTNASLPRAFLDDSNSRDEEVETVNGNYQISETPIYDRSVLGTQGQTMCDNIDVYWMTAVSGHTRQKRQETAHTPTGYCRAEYCYQKRHCFIWCWWSKHCYWYHNKCANVCDRVL